MAVVIDPIDHVPHEYSLDRSLEPAQTGRNSALRKGKAPMSVIRQGSPLVKTISFAVVHFTVAFTVAFLLTGSVAIAGAIALIEPLANTIAYYAHERFWQRLVARALHRQPQGAPAQHAA